MGFVMYCAAVYTMQISTSLYFIISMEYTESSVCCTSNLCTLDSFAMFYHLPKTINKTILLTSETLLTLGACSIESA